MKTSTHQFIIDAAVKSTSLFYRAGTYTEYHLAMKEIFRLSEERKKSRSIVPPVQA